MAKLTGKKKAEFLARMERGRKKAARSNPKRKAAKKKAPAKKKAAKKANGKLTGAKKAAFLKRMAAGRKKAARGNPNVRKQKKLFNKTFGKQVTREHLSGKKKAAKARKHGRRNSDGLDSAEAMFETFHQKRPGQVIEYDQLYRYPENYAELGKLIELRFYLDEANPDFPLTRFGDCQAVCTPDGNNIYFIGGDQTVNFEALDIASEKDFVELGPCTYICYFTVKGFHDFEPTKYWHRFGEEDRILPTLVYDRLNKSLFLTSGNYRVERAGIVN
jgi:hypothetical protein